MPAVFLLKLSRDCPVSNPLWTPPVSSTSPIRSVPLLPASFKLYKLFTPVPHSPFTQSCCPSVFLPDFSSRSDFSFLNRFSRHFIFFLPLIWHCHKSQTVDRKFFLNLPLDSALYSRGSVPPTMWLNTTTLCETQTSKRTPRYNLLITNLSIILLYVADFVYLWCWPLKHLMLRK